MVPRKLPLVAVLVLSAAGCAEMPFHGCPAGKSPVVAPVAVPKAAPISVPTPIAPVQRAILQSKPITITGINFRLNSSRLMSHDIQVLDQVADFARKHSSAVLDINGYCSEVGSYLYNLRLSQQRADSVARYLEDHGVSPSRMVLKGHSYNDPVASNATPQGRFANQRVDIISTIQVKKIVVQ
jgi:OOP family OmpA-OmpF porin